MKNVTIDNDHHFGGYAKTHPSLKKFCEMFIQETGIPVEHVYTGKMFYALNNLIAKDIFKPGSKIVCIHTGGVFNFEIRS